MGILLVYDVHHHRCNPDGLSVEEATSQAMATWDREPLFPHLQSAGGLEMWKNGSRSQVAMARLVASTLRPRVAAMMVNVVDQRDARRSEPRRSAGGVRLLVVFQGEPSRTLSGNRSGPWAKLLKAAFLSPYARRRGC